MASEGIPANAACAESAVPEPVGAKLVATGPPALAATPLKRSCKIWETPPVKFTSARSASAKAVGSSTAI
jgi:hypothetical protein